MFSKKVEEQDQTKQEKSEVERVLASVTLEKDNLNDYRDKFEREFVLRNEFQRKFEIMNELCESQGREYNERVQVIINEKQMIVKDNKELRNQLNEAQ